jgi:hypothetical protein
MLGKLKKLNRTNKIWLLLLCLLFVAVVVSAIQHKNTVTVTSNATQVINNTDSNLDDTTNPDTTTTQQNTATQTPQEATNAQCRVNGSLPDPTCTPGAIDPRVTQADIKQTICVSGYTKTVRPSSSITSAQKKVSMQQYGFTDSASNYEYDHLISLELGGAPDDTKNLWAEPGASPNPKDKIENKLHSLVCSGAMHLAEAQNRITTNWTTALSGY